MLFIYLKLIIFHAILKYQLSWSYRVDNMDSFDSILPTIPIGHHSWQVLDMASNVHTELMNVSFCWLANIGVSGERRLWVHPDLDG